MSAQVSKRSDGLYEATTHDGKIFVGSGERLRRMGIDIEGLPPPVTVITGAGVDFRPTSMARGSIVNVVVS